MTTTVRHRSRLLCLRIALPKPCQRLTPDNADKGTEDLSAAAGTYQTLTGRSEQTTADEMLRNM